jgi:hypothetical protein
VIGVPSPIDLAELAARIETARIETTQIETARIETARIETARIESAPARCATVTVVAIDGGAAAGKSSLATALAGLLPGSAVLSTDDLLDGWAGQFSFWNRLRQDVLAPLSQGRPAAYRRYDWVAGQFAELVQLPVPRVLLVEGVSAIAATGNYCSVAVFLRVERAIRERRWVERDGPLRTSWQQWLDNEDRFFAANPLPAGTLVIPGWRNPARW